MNKTRKPAGYFFRFDMILGKYQAGFCVRRITFEKVTLCCVNVKIFNSNAVQVSDNNDAAIKNKCLFHKKIPT